MFTKDELENAKKALQKIREIKREKVRDNIKYTTEYSFVLVSGLVIGRAEFISSACSKFVDQIRCNNISSMTENEVRKVLKEYCNRVWQLSGSENGELLVLCRNTFGVDYYGVAYAEFASVLLEVRRHLRYVFGKRDIDSIPNWYNERENSGKKHIPFQNRDSGNIPTGGTLDNYLNRIKEPITFIPRFKTSVSDDGEVSCVIVQDAAYTRDGKGYYIANELGKFVDNPVEQKKGKKYIKELINNKGSKLAKRSGTIKFTLRDKKD